MIRRAVKSDGYDVASLICAGWKTAYKGLVADELLESLSLDVMCKKWESNIENQDDNNNIYVYEENNEILGVIRFGKTDDGELNYNAEIQVLYVLPTLKRKGIGSKLFNYAKEYFINKNTTNMIIWCLKENLPSIAFYEKMGGKLTNEREAVVNGIKLTEIGLEYDLG